MECFSKIAFRGDTLGGINLTIKISAPYPGVLVERTGDTYAIAVEASRSCKVVLVNANGEDKVLEFATGGKTMVTR